MNENGAEIKFQEKTIDFCPNIKSFTTEKGSIYKKDINGEFIRYKYDGTIDLPQEFTFFINENKTGTDFQKLNHPNPKLRENMTVVVMQKEDNTQSETLEVIFSRKQVRDPNSVFIQIVTVNDDVVFGEQIPATLVPYESADVFEIESLISDKEDFCGSATKTHLGDKVTKINL